MDSCDKGVATFQHGRELHEGRRCTVMFLQDCLDITMITVRAFCFLHEAFGLAARTAKVLWNKRPPARPRRQHMKPWSGPSPTQAATRPRRWVAPRALTTPVRLQFPSCSSRLCLVGVFDCPAWYRHSILGHGNLGTWQARLHFSTQCAVGPCYRDLGLNLYDAHAWPPRAPMPYYSHRDLNSCWIKLGW